MSFEAEVRSVRGVWSEAATARGGGDAGDDLEGDLGGAEGFDLLVGAAEDEGIAGFEADDGLVAGSVEEHEGVDAGLSDAGLAAAFADGDDEGGGGGEGEDLGGDEIVGEDDVGVLQEMEGAEGEEGGVAGTGSYEVDAAGEWRWLGGRAHSSRLGLVRAWARA